MGRFEDFWQITGAALDHAMSVVELPDPALRAELMQHYMSLDIYPDVRKSLKTLKDAGLKTAILSNGSSTMLVAAVKNAGIDDMIDSIYSVDPVAIFKPHPTVYQIAVDELKSCSKISSISPPDFHKIVQVKDMMLDTKKLYDLGFDEIITIEEGIKSLCKS